MAYDGTKPFDTGYLADAPEELRENFRALKDDQIVDAGKLSGLSAGNATGKIPINNGEVNQNLNADLLDGKDASAFAASVHSHASATTSSDGFLSATDKVKLDGIDAGAEVNQNAFAGVAVGDVTISADSKSDTLIFKAGSGITLTADPENDTLTVTLGSHTHNYLPLSGGTVTGPIALNGGGNAIKSTVNTGNMTMYGGTAWNNSAYLNLNGGAKSSDAGSFSLVATNSSGTAKSLTGKPDGNLTWPGTISTTKLDAVGIELKTATPFIDFHYNNSSADYTARLINYSDGELVIAVCNTSGTQRNLTLNASGSLTWDGNSVLTTTSGNAVSSTVAARLARGGNTAAPMTFNWWGQPGQPAWLWGGNDSDPSNMYVYNPSAFNVNYANSSGSCSGNAASATKLATARNITVKYGRNQGTASFNGTSAITISIHCSSDYSDDGAA